MPAAGGDTNGELSESQTEASEGEGGCKNLTNIGYTHGVVISATELLGETGTGQPATDGSAQRAEEDEVEETRREKRRIERKEERAVHALLQECKWDRDPEMAIQAEDDRIQSEDEDDICRELDELTEEAEEGGNGKSYGTGKNKEGETVSVGTSETSQKRAVGLAGATLQGPSREGTQVYREGRGFHQDSGASRRSGDRGGRKDTARHIN